MDKIEGAYNRHYIIVRADGAIIKAWSDGPCPENDTANAICINEQGGYQFRFTPDGEENPNLYTMDGIPLYKWDGEKVIPRAEEEIAAEHIALLNSPERRAAEIKQRFAEIDSQKIRPLSAIALGTATKDDTDKLAELETQAVILRNELANIMIV